MSRGIEVREHSEAYKRIMKRRKSRRIRARRARARFAIKFASALCLILLCAVIFGRSTLYASVNEPETPVYKYYTSIRIEKGDTLDKIASKYITKEYSSKAKYINEVRFINHIEGDLIHAGCYIVVPYYSEELK